MLADDRAAPDQRAALRLLVREGRPVRPPRFSKTWPRSGAAGTEVHLATVQEPLRADYLWTTLGLRERFDALHYAADLRAKKSDPAFYAAVEARTGFAPADLVLIDDTAANIEVARACGWGGLQWTGDARLLDILPT